MVGTVLDIANDELVGVLSMIYDDDDSLLLWLLAGLILALVLL